VSRGGRRIEAVFPAILSFSLSIKALSLTVTAYSPLLKRTSSPSTKSPLQMENSAFSWRGHGQKMPAKNAQNGPILSETSFFLGRDPFPVGSGILSHTPPLAPTKPSGSAPAVQPPRRHFTPPSTGRPMTMFYLLWERSCTEVVCEVVWNELRMRWHLSRAEIKSDVLATISNSSKTGAADPSFLNGCWHTQHDGHKQL